MKMNFVLLAAQNISSHTSEIIGLIGTLAGTFIGWLLHFLSDNAGKTHIFADELCDRKARQREYAYIIKIMVFNSSHKKQCMRNIRFSFKDKKGKEMFESWPGEGSCTWEIVRSKNVNKKNSGMQWVNSYTPVEFIFSDWLEGNDYEQLSSVKKIYFQYEDRKNHTKKILIKKNFDLSNVEMWKWDGFT